MATNTEQAIEFATKHADTRYEQLCGFFKQKIGQLILDAAYEGTTRAAAFLKKKKVFLTLVGGGVFGNPLEWIVCAIAKNKDFIVSSRLSVTLIIYDGSYIVADALMRTIINKLVYDTKGSYVRYDSAHPEGQKIKV